MLVRLPKRDIELIHAVLGANPRHRARRDIRPFGVSRYGAGIVNGSTARFF